MEKGKVKLLIIANDTARASKEKMIREAERMSIEYRIYGDGEELSHSCGESYRNVFAVTDSNFAKVIVNEIDTEKNVKEVL